MQLANNDLEYQQANLIAIAREARDRDMLIEDKYAAANERAAAANARAERLTKEV